MSACGPSVVDVITCVVHYTIDPDQIAAFEQFARAWMRHVDEHGGTHHGYYLPAEGVSDRAESLFSFPSLAAYEQYRTLFGTHSDFIGCCCNLGREPRKLRFYCVINAMCLCCQAVSNTRLTITASGFG